MHATLTEQGLRLHDGVPTLEQMQQVVDGYIETALRIPSSRPGTSIDIYCNDSGLMDRLPCYYRRATDGVHLAGNLIAVASNAEGETIALHDEDIPLILGHLIPFFA